MDNSDKHLWETYINQCDPYFNICTEQSVLEIGSFQGLHTKTILSKNPKSLTLIEPDKKMSEMFLENNSAISEKCSIINEDIVFYLNEKRSFDVVICCGVLYHLHNPFYLLELIANRINPKLLILETFTSPTPELFYEELNITGNRQAINWRSCTVRLMFPKHFLIKAMDDLGFDLIDEAVILKPSNQIIPADFMVFKNNGR